MPMKTHLWMTNPKTTFDSKTPEGRTVMIKAASTMRLLMMLTLSMMLMMKHMGKMNT